MKTVNTPWNTLHKIAFRFWFIYLVNYILASGIIANISFLWNYLVYFISGQFNINVPTQPNASGDTTYNYIQFAAMVSIALLGSLIWSLIDKKRISYNLLSYIAEVLTRYFLGLALVFYGFGKINLSQFPFPDLYTLNEPFGDSSPMGLAWAFMGYSPAYNIIIGSTEAISGVFLFIRRTKTFGALMSMVVMANVVALNFCYDIPVKLFSSHLLIMGIYIASADIKRLVAFFFLNTEVPKPSHYTPSLGKKMKIAAICIKVLLLGYIGYTNIEMLVMSLVDKKKELAVSPLYGVYSVEEFRVVATLSAIGNQHIDHFTEIYFDKGSRANFVNRDPKSREIYNYRLDTNRNLLMFVNRFSDKDTIRFHLTKSNMINFNQNDSNVICLNGWLKNDSLAIKIRPKNGSSSNLEKTGFHWINERPNNQ